MLCAQPLRTLLLQLLLHISALSALCFEHCRELRLLFFGAFGQRHGQLLLVSALSLLQLCVQARMGSHASLSFGSRSVSLLHSRGSSNAGHLNRLVGPCLRVAVRLGDRSLGLAAALLQRIVT